MRRIFRLQTFLVPALLLTVIWVVFFLQHIGLFSGCRGALIPRAPEGLAGVLFSPLLHGSFDHIVSNSLPLAVLSFLLYQFYSRIATRVLIIGWVAAGFLVWLLPPDSFYHGSFRACIIGASGIVYMLAFFLFFSGVLRWDLKLLTVSLVVAFYYGSMIWGMVPEELLFRLEEPSRVSWQSHLAGAAVGFGLAYLFRKKGERKRKYIWEYPRYYNEKDDRLWQKYREEHPQDFEEMPQLKKDDLWEHLEELRKREK